MGEKNAASSTVWQREVQCGKGNFFDTAQPHALSYFTDDPFLRDDGDDFCADCSVQGKARIRGHHTFKAEVSKVGEVGRFGVYDLFYYFDHGIESRKIGRKSILVSVGAGQFREIYHLQPTAALIRPAYFVKAGSTEVLATRDVIQGTGNSYYEAYWWFGEDGPVRTDAASAVSKALEGLLPSGFAVRKGGGLSMEELIFQSGVWRPGDANCCPTGGRVTVKFRLERGRLRVMDRRFKRDFGN